MILWLGSAPLIEALQIADRLTLEEIECFDPEFIISFGYRHILLPEIVDKYACINLHIAYLPWNRGADPNLWSIIDGTPKGISIHYMDAGLDTGDLICQQEVAFSPDDTLRTSYEKLQTAMRNLFLCRWPFIKAGKAPRYRQEGIGSYHRSDDKDMWPRIMPDGWDTPIAFVENFVIDTELSNGFIEQYRSECHNNCKMEN